MAFIDNMKNKLSQVSQTTVQKAKDLSEIAKLNVTVSGAEKQIDGLYRQIGAEIYKAYCEAPLPEVAELIAQITELYQTVNTCKEQIKTLSNADTCPQCGAKISKGMAFCSGCGYKISEEEQANSAERSSFCTGCGAAITSDSAFCTSCGKKIDK